MHRRTQPSHGLVTHGRRFIRMILKTRLHSFLDPPLQEIHQIYRIMVIPLRTGGPGAVATRAVLRKRRSLEDVICANIFGAIRSHFSAAMKGVRRLPRVASQAEKTVTATKPSISLIYHVNGEDATGCSVAWTT